MEGHRYQDPVQEVEEHIDPDLAQEVEHIDRDPARGVEEHTDQDQVEVVDAGRDRHREVDVR